jgi:hypothetical protein
VQRLLRQACLIPPQNGNDFDVGGGLSRHGFFYPAPLVIKNAFNAAFLAVFAGLP